MRNRKSLCLRCQHLFRKPPNDVLRCALGKSIITISNPNVCRNYTPVEQSRTEVPNTEQLHLFGSLTA